MYLTLSLFLTSCQHMTFRILVAHLIMNEKERNWSRLEWKRSLGFAGRSDWSDGLGFALEHGNWGGNSGLWRTGAENNNEGGGGLWVM